MEIIRKQSLDLRIKSRLHSPKRKRSLCLPKISFFSNFSVDGFALESGLFLFWELLIQYFAISSLFLDQLLDALYFCQVLRITGSRSLKCGLDILGFPRIIYNVRKLYEPKTNRNLIRKLNEPENQNM